MQWRSGFIFLFSLVTLQVPAQDIEPELSNLVDSVYRANTDAVGILIHVESPNNALSFTKAVGFSDRSRTKPLTADQPTLLASITKSYVSAAVLVLVDDGELRLEDPVANLIADTSRKMLEGDGYALDQITVRHLLSHTSGIHDYVDSAYFDLVISRPQYPWTKDEQIARAVAVGEPLAEPGVAYSYGDINYLLLGEILVRITGKPYHVAVRELLRFDSLGLGHTWFEGLEQKPAALPPFAHQYAKDFGWDSYQLNPAWDLHGGGGLAGTVKDVALFYQYLFSSEEILSKALQQKMTSYVLPPAESRYCLGLYRFDFGYQLYYHGGWWGTGVNYSPDTNTAVAVFTLVKEKRGQINPFLGKRIHDLLLEKN